MHTQLDSGFLPSATRQRPNCTRQRTHGKKLIGKTLFAESICRVPRGHSAKKSDHHGAGLVDGHFAECQPCRHSANIFLIFFEKFLCRVPTREALGKELLFFFWKFSLPSAKPPGTRQIFFIFFWKILCRASTRKALGKELLFFLEIFFAESHHSTHSAKIFF